MTDREIRQNEVEARLYSSKEPTEGQKERLRRYLEKTRQKPFRVVWKEDRHVRDGFRIELGTDPRSGTACEVFD